MGPITLFDKSFIQSLSVDESVWFDKFFLPVVCPMFFIETLADLAKTPRDGRTPEAEVRIIASKFPEVSGSPSANYRDLAIHNLLGIDVPMDGRIPRAGGRYVKWGKRSGVVYDQSPEEEAFLRWQREQFADVERLFASDWRKALNTVNLQEIADTFKVLGVSPQSCKSFADAKQMAYDVMSGRSQRFARLGLAVRLLQVPQHFHHPLVEQWKSKGEPSLDLYAPYAAFVLTVEMFFYISLGAGLISPNRNSNRTDIGYLFYLPFCHVFVSSDRLHQRVADSFLREDQQFVWGQDLKSDLKKINDHYTASIPESQREAGLMKLVNHPPTQSDVVSELWRRYTPGSADHHKNLAEAMDPASEKALVEEMMAFTKGKTLSPDKLPSEDEQDTMSIERHIKMKRGSWWQLPKDLKDRIDS